MIAPVALLFTLLVHDPQQVAAWLAENKVPAVGVAVIRDGKLREVAVHGELMQGTPAPYDTLFNVASLTKPVVAMLTLRLVQEGKWQLDEPLAKYYVDPDVAGDPRHRLLTTRHVLTHQTGFRNWRREEESKKLTFHSDPGTKFGYSGEGFEYLRKALEKKFGKSLSELSRAYVFAPAGMHDTRHAWDARTDESRFARWHDAEGRNAYTDHKTTTANAADDLLTTAEDYGRFGAWVMSGAGLSDALFRDMITPHAKMRDNASIGLGWEVHSGLPGDEYALIHSGSDRGVHAVVILLPKSKQGVVVLTNSDNGYRLYERAVIESLTVGEALMKRAR